MASGRVSAVAAGYSGKPLAVKLGIKPGTKVAAIGPPANYRELLGRLPAGATIGSKVAPNAPFIHVFATSRRDLAAKVASYRKVLAPDGTLWVSWPKKSSGVSTDVTEDAIREVALPLGFVDVKVCAVDETWSGLKLVVRLSERG